MDTTHSDSALTLNARSPFLAYAHCKFLLNGGILRPAAFRQTLNVTRERIVAKVDTLFGHLDQLRSRLDKIPVLLKQFRQAVLTQAVTGKLTEIIIFKFDNLLVERLTHKSKALNEKNS